MNDCVDILIATYNGEKFLSEQLQSILEQTHQNIRIIVRDDNSADGTRQLIETFCRNHPNKITLLPRDKNLGIKGNFSALMEQADADYVMLSDQDDKWMPDKVEKTLKKMLEVEKKRPSGCPILIHSDLVVVDKDLKTLEPSFWCHSNLRPKSCSALNRLLVQNIVTGCTAMINKPLLKLALPIPKEAVMHDWWLGLVAAAFGCIDLINESTVLYRQHGNNAVGAKKIGNSVLSLFESGKLQAYRRDFAKNEQENLKQAVAFYQRYQMDLSNDQKSLVQSYIEWPTSPYFKKRYLTLKHGFFSNNRIKNFVSFFWI